MLNVFVSIATGNNAWERKITSLLDPSEYTEYNETNYQTAPTNDWIIAVENGDSRISIANNELSGLTFATLFEGDNNLNDVTVGSGLTVGPSTLIRPGVTLGNQVYIGSNCVIDLDAEIGNGVTIEDNCTIMEGSILPDNYYLQSGTLVYKGRVYLPTLGATV